ncbi:hypothetical protein NE237_030655 [Protea cynaroides]|uniref:Uncharacterized protein n=1 Tax=Protea cynaroides TaxID=273540 RepID=A0A9Q0JXI2_9MAGN|nr:hypothetical protein NE237_030655 [Protea cynaroides]
MLSYQRLEPGSTTLEFDWNKMKSSSRLARCTPSDLGGKLRQTADRREEFSFKDVSLKVRTSFPRVMQVILVADNSYFVFCNSSHVMTDIERRTRSNSGDPSKRLVRLDLVGSLFSIL